MAEQPLTRRQTLAGAAVVGVGAPLLAACGGEEPTTASDPAGSTPASSTPSGSDGGAAPAPQGLASTADIPVGGGQVFADDNVVIVQPAEGQFRGWSATCTHQGCAVTRVEDGTIHCPCHNSVFSIEDGSPQSGPATQPLSEVPLTVEGDSISLA